MEEYKKKYEEAMLRMNKWVEGSEIIDPKEVAEFVFPELKESEDEMIRKWLIKAMKHLSEESTFFLKVPKDKVIAWLEKQGEQNYKHLYDVIMALWDLLDKIDTFSDLQIDDTNPDNPFKKIEYIAQERHKFVKSDGYNLYIQGERITDFKQSKQKPAWSEEDEKMWSTISDLLWEGYKLSDKKVSWNKIRCWLLPKIKSLKERYTWKPSDEQMKQLGLIAEQNKDNMIGKELMSLYQELKKLKGE